MKTLITILLLTGSAYAETLKVYEKTQIKMDIGRELIQRTDETGRVVSVVPVTDEYKAIQEVFIILQKQDARILELENRIVDLMERIGKLESERIER